MNIRQDVRNCFKKLLKEKFSVENCSEIMEAYNLSDSLHSGQKRHSGEDFFEHPISVSLILLEWNATKEMIIAALMHDTVEDSTITNEKILELFGQNVFLYVYALTKDIEKNVDLQKNMFFLKEQPEVLKIKLADRLHNMRTIDHLPKHKQENKCVETLDVYVPIARFLKMYSVAEELKEIAEYTLKNDLNSSLQ